MEHGKKYLREIWKEISGGTKISSIENFEDIWLKALFVSNNPELFVTSFTGISLENKLHQENGILSQWRGYGNNGGFAIIFDSITLASSYNSFIKNCKIHNAYQSNCNDCKICFKANIFDKVIYNHNFNMIQNHPQIGIARTFLDGFCTALVNDTQITVTQSDHDYFRMALYLMCILKHPAFEEENEIRFVCLNRLEKHTGGYHNESPYQICAEDQKPRLKIDFNPAAIKKIIIGPQKNQDQMQIYLKYFLENMGYLDVDVTKSEIPFIPV